MEKIEPRKKSRWEDHNKDLIDSVFVSWAFYSAQLYRLKRGDLSERSKISTRRFQHLSPVPLCLWTFEQERALLSCWKRGAIYLYFHHRGWFLSSLVATILGTEKNMGSCNIFHHSEATGFARNIYSPHWCEINRRLLF